MLTYLQVSMIMHLHHILFSLKMKLFDYILCLNLGCYIIGYAMIELAAFSFLVSHKMKLCLKIYSTLDLVYEYV